MLLPLKARGMFAALTAPPVPPSLAMKLLKCDDIYNAIIL